MLGSVWFSRRWRFALADILAAFANAIQQWDYGVSREEIFFLDSDKKVCICLEKSRQIFEICSLNSVIFKLNAADVAFWKYEWFFKT